MPTGRIPPGRDTFPPPGPLLGVLMLSQEKAELLQRVSGDPDHDDHDDPPSLHQQVQWPRCKKYKDVNANDQDDGDDHKDSDDNDDDNANDDDDKDLLC